MKKEYIKPAINIIFLQVESNILAGSGEDQIDKETPGTGTVIPHAPKNPGIWDEWEEDEN